MSLCDADAIQAPAAITDNEVDCDTQALEWTHDPDMDPPESCYNPGMWYVHHDEVTKALQGATCPYCGATRVRLLTDGWNEESDVDICKCRSCMREWTRSDDGFDEYRSLAFTGVYWKRDVKTGAQYLQRERHPCGTEYVGVGYALVVFGDDPWSKVEQPYSVELASFYTEYSEHDVLYAYCFKGLKGRSTSCESRDLRFLRRHLDEWLASQRRHV